MKKSNLVRTLILAGGLLLQLSTLCFHSHGAAGDLDLSFDPGSGVNGGVSAVAVQPDGKVIIGGGFTTVKGLARSKVARLNVDGSGDSSFDTGTEPEAWGYYVHAVALQSDGKVLVGHDHGLTRLNSDGSLDTNFVASIDCCASVSLIAVQPDGKVLIGRYSGIIRLNSNGSLDNSFTAGAGGDEGVHSIALQPDGKVLIGGSFSTTNGTNDSYGIARLNSNGSLDSNFHASVYLWWYYPVTSLAVQPDGKVLIGGDFTTVNGTNRNRIARLNTDGSLDGSFNPGTGADNTVLAIALQADGKVLIGGSFTTVNGTNRNRMARLNSDGSLDSSFNPGTGFSDNTSVNSVVVKSDGQVLIGGNFTRVNGTNHDYFDRLNADGSQDSSFNPGTGVNRFVASLVVQPDGKVLIGGDFTTVKNLARSAIARLNADGSGDSSFNAPVYPIAYGGWYPMSLQPDGKVLVGRMIARLNADGIVDNNFHPDLAVLYNPDCPSGYECFEYVVVNAVAVQSDGKVLLGGQLVRYECDLNEGGCVIFYRYFVIRLHSNGSRDTSFEPAAGYLYVASSVVALVVQPDGKVIVGGSFSSIKGTNRNSIARLNADGSLDNSFNPGTGASGNVSSVALQSNGKVLIGGGFAFVNGTYRQGIARLNMDGTLDNSFNPGTGANGNVPSVIVQSDGKVLIGGSFTSVNGTNRNRIARLNADGSLDNSFNPGIGADGNVSSIALQSDGKVLIGGDFSTVNGAPRPYVARLYGNSAVVPSLNIARSNAFVIVSWPVSGTNFRLEESTNLSLPNGWSAFTGTRATNNNTISVTVPANGGSRFYRVSSQ